MTRRTNVLSAEEIAQLQGTIQSDIVDFKTALQLFLNDCELRNLRNHTIRYYRSELTTFYKLLNSQTIDSNPVNITIDVLKVNVITYMKTTKQNKPITINTRLRAIRAFFNFLYDERYIKNNPVRDLKLLKVRRDIIPVFNKDQIKHLLKQPDMKTFIGFRDYTIILLLLETGIRVNELVGITIGDIKWEDSLLLIRNAKGYKERMVPIQSFMKEHLRKYISIRVTQKLMLYLFL